MPDPLDGAPPATPPAAPTPEGRARKMKCEFCECELVGSGDYLKLSEKAKKLRNLEEINSTLEASISTLQREIAELKKLQPESRPVKQGVW